MMKMKVIVIFTEYSIPYFLRDSVQVQGNIYNTVARRVGIAVYHRIIESKVIYLPWCRKGKKKG
jgi:hypothetical protein